MNFSDFSNYLKLLVSIHNKSIDLSRFDLKSNQLPKNFLLFMDINKSFDIDKYIKFEITDKGLVFCFHEKNEYQFLIKKEDWNLEDPPLFYNNKPFLNNSSTFLLIELADWYSKISPNIYILSGLNPQLWDSVIDFFEKDIFIPGGGFYKHLKITEKVGAFFISDGSSGTKKYTIVAQDKETLDNILNNLGLIRQNKEEKVYNSNIITKGKILDNVLNGEIWFISDFVKISVTLTKNNPSENDFEKVIKKWYKKITSKLTNIKLEEIKKGIAKEISTVAYSQTQTDEFFISSKQEQLYVDLEINTIAFYEDALCLLFKSKNEFPDCLINCILNEKLSIEECILE